MKEYVEYQPIVDEFFRNQREHPLVFKSPRHNPPRQQTLKDLHDLRMPDTAPLEVEYRDSTGYHRAQVTGAWESESGAMVLTVGKDVTVPERTDAE